jgi:hypothetical protein
MKFYARARLPNENPKPVTADDKCYESRVSRWSRCELARITAIAALMFSGLFQCESRVINLGLNPLAEGGNGGSTSIGSTAGNSASGGSSSDGGSAGSAGVSGSFEEPLFGTIELVTELAATSSDDIDENPTLTQDLLEIYFTSNRDGGSGSDDVWMAQRTAGDDSFGEPVPVDSVNTDRSETSPAISADGQVLWVGVELDGGLGGRDIWRFERTGTAPEFGTAINEPNVNSTEDDIPRPPGNAQRTMPLASHRGDAVYTTYLATRPSVTADFTKPVLLEELVVDNLKLTDAFLTDDGLDIYFVRAKGDIGDIYVAHRETLTSPFGTAIALSTINTDQDERDPWLSPDGSRLYFVSNRSGVKRIYQAARETN